MRGLFPAALALSVGLGACGGVTERRRPEVDLRGAAGAPATDDCPCVDEEIGWWVETGLAPPETESHILPCNSFSYRHEAEELCGTRMDDCSFEFNLARLSATLRSDDVQRALADAPVVFGRDRRGKGGQVDHIEVGGKVVEIGDSCDDAEPCPIPAGVAKLVHELTWITRQQRGTCERL